MQEKIAGKGELSADPLLSSVRGKSTADTHKHAFVASLKEVASDLQSNSLAEKYADALFAKINKDGDKSVAEIVKEGEKEFYHIGKDVLGPIAASFVDTVLQECHGMAIFPARDATPFWYAAKALKGANPGKYPVASENIINPVFNRTIWGIADEQDAGSDPLSLDQPLVKKLLSQMGFFSSTEKVFVEVGSWGSMVHQLNTSMQTGELPKEKFKVYFFYTHLPEYIYGFTNIHGDMLPGGVLETIADTWEAFPKLFKKPTKLVEKNDIVEADLDGKLVDSAFLPAWTFAALHGVTDAALDFADEKQHSTPRDELIKLWKLSKAAKTGTFTGVLPTHTETWSEGEKWKAAWKWGPVPPLV